MARDDEQAGLSALGIVSTLGVLSLICCGGLGALQPLIPTQTGAIAVAPAVPLQVAPSVPIPPEAPAPVERVEEPAEPRVDPDSSQTPASTPPPPARRNEAPVDQVVPVVAPAPGPIQPVLSSPEPVPTVGRANVFVEGDAKRVVARGKNGSYALPGSVPMGSYEIEVVFDGGPFVATSMLIVDDNPKHVVCRSSLAICKVR